jgi:hypothetical protein
VYVYIYTHISIHVERKGSEHTDTLDPLSIRSEFDLSLEKIKSIFGSKNIPLQAGQQLVLATCLPGDLPFLCPPLPYGY